ncbi:4896_t:CDS:2 [Funneliformis geosporum]|uniref:10925_t:CDS:1 n=1 Tax=Funneliformis geosporum TaxID=1117311 RepID=A0A9W4WNP7_9GLOM|nr:4896_t:CDS:2 [Funneliformis geosporum]CAI2175507.1 10925_t:CDS:2 [Funneliformis geosporum]
MSVLNNKVMPELPPVCIKEIIEQARDNKKTLYKLLFVNRTWCNIVVPTLWSNPFDIIEESSNLIINTYISCFNSYEEIHLINHGFELPRQRIPLLYNYPEYLQSFDTENFMVAIKIWLKIRRPKRQLSKDNLEKTKFFVEMLGNMLFRNSRGLHNLTISHHLCQDFKCLQVSFDGLKRGLINLVQFKFDCNHMLIGDCQELEVITNIGRNLTLFANNIQHIYIGNIKSIKILKAFLQLIRAQSNLTSLEFESWEKTSIFEAYSIITSQFDTLKYLKLNGIINIYTLVSVLKFFTNLESLVLYNYHEFGNEQLQQNFRDRLPVINLKNLYILKSNHTTKICLESLIKSAKFHNLQSLNLDEVTPRILKIIQKHFVNLKSLFIFISDSYLSNIMQILPSLRSLQKLVLSETRKGRWKSQNLQSLAKTFPTSLINLGIFALISDNELDTFLKSLTVEIHEMNLFNEEMTNDRVLDVITNYAENNGYLKKVGFNIGKSGKFMFSDSVLDRARKLIGEIKPVKLEWIPEIFK